MNTPDNKQKKHENADQIDDLTRFLDEDFDTDDVDLFEFTTEEDSPLTELKSIVLSLDWEITDDTLQDLADEIEHLKGLEMFQADKVSQVYLQGLSKIGHYIQSEGAYAHPNSIKLLLTLYYDFEKILSSETITGSEITALLKADVRKFKILQYQIAQKHGVEAPAPAVAEAKELGLAVTDSEALRGIRALILELDWEITDESLERLTKQLDTLKEKYGDDHFIQVLVQGLFSLNSYISEERSRAHPEAFSLLHTFCEGLAKLIENSELSDEERQTIIVEQVNSLNNLKALVAGTAEGVEVLEEEAIEEIEGEEPALAAEEFPAAEAEEEVEPFAEEPLGEGVEVAPALAGEIEESEILEEAPPEELAEKLEFFFGEEEKVPPPEPEAAITEEPGIAPALAGEEELEERPAPFAEEALAEDLEVAPALAGDESEGSEILEEEPPEELAEKLKFFFGEEEKVPPPEPAAVTEEAVEELEELEEGAAPFAEEALVEDLEVAPALAGDESEGTEILEEEPAEELAENLEFFFGGEEEVAPFEGAEPPPLTEKIAEEVAEVPEEPGEEFEAEEEVVPALAGSPEEAGFGIDEELEKPPEGLEEKLEGFFGEEKPAEAAEAEAAAEPVEEIAPVAEEAEEGFAAIFEEEKVEVAEEAPEAEEEEMLLTPALAEEEEFNIPALARPMKTEEDFQAAVTQIRTHFQEQEASLRQEIELLKEEIKNLRAQLGS